MRRTILLILVLTLALAGEAVASGTDVLRDCTDDGRLKGTYSQQELSSALANIPSDVDEYTDCRDVIKNAQLNAASGGDDGGADAGTGTASGGDAGTGTSTATGGGAGSGSTEEDNPKTGRTSGQFGGFDGFEEDPLKAASAEEQQAVADAITTRPPEVSQASGPFADADLPTPLWIVLGLGAAGLVALAASDLRRRVVARRLA